MLVLSRHVNEVILIGDDIRVTVVEIEKHRVKIGIEAPRSVEVWRSELKEKKEKENGEETK